MSKRPKLDDYPSSLEYAMALEKYCECLECALDQANMEQTVADQHYAKEGCITIGYSTHAKIVENLEKQILENDKAINALNETILKLIARSHQESEEG